MLVRMKKIKKSGGNRKGKGYKERGGRKTNIQAETK
jgi:hypothetical protein